MDVTCRNCSTALARPAASITVLGQGDEYTYAWYECPVCGQWTLKDVRDAFMGDVTTTLRGPFPPDEGARRVADIRRCPAPDDAYCRCDVHGAW